MTTSLAPYRWLPPGQKPPRGSRIRGGHPLTPRRGGLWLFNNSGGGAIYDVTGRTPLTFTGGAWTIGPNGPMYSLEPAASQYSASAPVPHLVGVTGYTIAAEVYMPVRNWPSAQRFVTVNDEGSALEDASLCIDNAFGGLGAQTALVITDGGGTQRAVVGPTTQSAGDRLFLVGRAQAGHPMALWTNGVKTTGDTPANLQATQQTLQVGRLNGLFQQYGGGVYGYIGIWPYALSDAAIAWLLRDRYAMVAPPAPGPGQWYVTISGAPLAAGSISVTTPATDTTVGLTVTEATGGTGPYTRQWYRSTSSGFTPNGGSALSGKTSLTLADTGLTPSTTYYYKVVQTDSAAASVTTTQQAVTTDAAAVAGTEGNLMSVAMGGVILMSDATQPLLFQMLSNVNNYTPVPGVTPTVLISKAGDTFATPAGTVSEIAHGWWQVEPDADDRDTTGELLLYAEATGCAPASVRYQIVAFDPADPVRLGITALPDADAAASAGLPLRNQLPTANENADALLDRANGIETGLTLRGMLRLLGAGIAGKLSGGGTTTNTIRNVGDTKNRITATVDSNGNRTAVTTDAT